MKTFKFKVPVEKIPSISKDAASIARAELDNQRPLFEDIISNGLAGRYKEGVGGDVQRNVRKIIQKLDAATGDTLELEDSEFKVLESIFEDDNARWAPAQTRIVGFYCDNLEAAREAAKAKKEEPKPEEAKA